MLVLTVDEAYERLVRQRGGNRWFLRADLVAWPKCAWTSSASTGGWSIIAGEEGAVLFGARTIDQYRRAVEISLVEPSLRCHEAAVQYSGDYLNAAATICWLPADAARDDLRSITADGVVVPGHYNTGAGVIDAVVIEIERKDDHAYLSIP